VIDATWESVKTRGNQLRAKYPVVSNAPGNSRIHVSAKKPA
jgi:hypothetical protein